jgi:glycosyltransferase involved in cell wall biosynthesis
MLGRPPGTAPSVGLVMIVRNEEVTLPRLAASVAGQVDYFTIVDTGSTDRTLELAGEVFAGLPGQVLGDEWRGFGASRTVALRAAEPFTDWLLFLDADEVLDGRLDRSALREDLDAVELCQRSGDVQLWLPRLAASGRGWQWKGRTHEYLDLPGGQDCYLPRSEAVQASRLTLEVGA